MIMIEIDQEVSRKLEKTAIQLGITRNGVLRQLLKLNNSIILSFTESTTKTKKSTKADIQLISNNIQDELIPHIIKILYENGGKATKNFVESKVFMLFQHEFEKPYYNETVSHGILRWKHNIAWAKERAKQIHGFIKSADESGRGIWELTDDGIAYCENSL